MTMITSGVNTTAALKVIPQNQFQNCFEGWTRRWQRCIVFLGNTLKTNRVVFNKKVCSTSTAKSSRTLLSDHVHLYSQQQHTVFISSHSHLSTVDSLDVLRVTVLLWVQSDSHRRLRNREGQCAKLSTDGAVEGF